MKTETSPNEAKLKRLDPDEKDSEKVDILNQKELKNSFPHTNTESAVLDQGAASTKDVNENKNNARF